jgi:hypothetical protein
MLDPVHEATPDIELTATRGRITVSLRAHRLGDDLSVTIGGGDRPHLGAVAVSSPRPDRGAAADQRATTSVITLPHHREDELARRTSARLASSLGVNACVACGVHVEAITRDEIRDVEALVEELATALLARLRPA